jgi:hypothetical protein
LRIVSVGNPDGSVSETNGTFAAHDTYKESWPSAKVVVTVFQPGAGSNVVAEVPESPVRVPDSDPVTSIRVTVSR